MAIIMSASLHRRAALLGGSCLLLTGCGDDGTREIKSLKTQVQDRWGAKEFAKGYELAVKGFDLSRKLNGDKHPDTLYFAQAVTETATGARNMRAAQKALKTELDVRSAAGQSEDKLQRRRTLLIKLAEESGDKATAIAQTVIIAKVIKMGPGKDPQPTYRPDESPYPIALAKDRVEGDVDLSFSLDADGKPGGIKVIKATPRNVFDQAAIDHLQKWRFTPFIENGQPVSSTGHHYLLGFRMPR